jgi:hypothetical protein
MVNNSESTRPIDLIGTWVSDPEDPASVREYGTVSMSFSPEGRLVYSVFSHDATQIILLNYRVERNVLITDQPSSRKEERTRFLLSDGKLILLYGDHKSTYVRAG